MEYTIVIVIAVLVGLSVGFINQSFLRKKVAKVNQKEKQRLIKKSRKPPEEIVISVRNQDDSDLDFEDALNGILHRHPNPNDFITLEADAPVNGVLFLQLLYRKNQYEVEACLLDKTNELVYYRAISIDVTELEQLFYDFYFQHKPPNIEDWEIFNL